MKWRRGGRVSPEIPTASMADIAFLLICFFLVSTTMNQDKGLSLHLPAMGEGQEVQQRNICNIWLTAEDEVAIYDTALTEEASQEHLTALVGQP